MFQKRVAHAGGHLCGGGVLLVVRAVGAPALFVLPILGVNGTQRVGALLVPHPRLLLPVGAVLKGGVHEDRGVCLSLHRGDGAALSEAVSLGVVRLGAEGQIHRNRLQHLNVVIY